MFIGHYAVGTQEDGAQVVSRCADSRGGPPPPNMTVIGIMLTAEQTAYIAFVYWIDKDSGRRELS